MKGFFITLEGVEGAGKSTLMDFIADVLKKEDHDILLTREPGGTETGERIRDVLLDKRNRGLSGDAELLLMFAARAQHIDEIIRPALNAGRIVVCDRFTDASYAYQGAGRGIPYADIKQLEDWVQKGLRPDLTFLLDLDVETGLRRIGKRNETDRFEQEKTEFFQRVRQCYLERAETEKDRFRIIDAEKSLDEVKKQIFSVLKEENLC